MFLKFGVDTQSQTKVELRKPRYPVWSQCNHFQKDSTENQQASTRSHKLYA